MNKRMIGYIAGVVLLIEAGLMLLPALVALIYREIWPMWSFVISAGIVAAAGFLLTCFPVRDKTIYTRDGLLSVGICWIFMSLGGALPFVISGEIPSFVDAFFEIVSGFTTTGASILTNIEALSHGMLFWRSFSHWIGGMGVLVFAIAAIPLAGGGGNINLLRAESPGPEVSKLVPNSRGTAVRLYSIYLALTLLEVALLVVVKTPLFDALTLSFGTAGTGGFAIKNSSVADYSSAVQIIITVFMAAFGVNFSCYYLLLIGKVKELLKNEELRVYLGTMAAVIVVVTLNVRGMYDTLGQSLLHAAFQTSSIMTTTGFATTDFDLWPELSRMLMLLIMFIGACVGSTGGGIKVARVVILAKQARRQLRSAVRPNRVETIAFNGRPVSDSMLQGIIGFFLVYVIIFVVSILLITLDGHDTVTNITAVIATLNNIGPGLGQVGATGNYALYSPLSKLVLTADMLLGRLELFPLLSLFAKRK